MRVFLTAILLGGVASPATATIMNSGTVSAGVKVVLGSDLAGFTTGPSSTAVPGTVGSLSFASGSDGAGNSAAASHGVTGRWDSADAGFIDILWAWQVASSGVNTEVNTNVTIADWVYNFTATGNGTFSGRYDVVGQGDKFGLQPIYGGDDLPFGPYGGSVADPTGNGNFSVALVNGQTYNMRFFNYGNLSSAGGFTADGSARALIDWRIVYSNSGGIPEPTSWAMLITGFGLVGAAARRRRATAA